MSSGLRDEQLRLFLEKYAHDRIRIELLDFWRRHPNARFAVGAISCALDCRRLETRRALVELVENGVVDTVFQNGLTLYFLTPDEARRRLVLEVATIDWEKWRALISFSERRITARDQIAAREG